MPSKKAKLKAAKLSSRGYSTSSSASKRQLLLEEQSAAQPLVAVVLNAGQGGVRLRIAPWARDGGSPVVGATAASSMGGGSSSENPNLQVAIAPAAEPDAPRGSGAEPAGAPPACLPSQATYDIMAELDEDDIFMLDEDAAQMAAPKPQPSPQSPRGSSSARRGPRTSAPASYAAAISPVLTAAPSPATPGQSLGSQPMQIPERQRSDRAWNPEDAANSVPLERFPASAPSAILREAWPLPSPDGLTPVKPPGFGGGASSRAGPAAADGEADAAAAEDEDAASSEEEEEGVMCAICHGNIQPMQAAMVRGCEHPFCVGCILNWTLQKSKCPLCQTPFTHLWLYRELDGSYNDYLVESSVELLHCAQWFRRDVAGGSRLAQPGDEEPDDYHEMLQYRFGGAEEEEDDEDYYYGLQERLSSRRPVGNRRFGQGGYVQAGRKAAKATAMAPPTPKGKSLLFGAPPGTPTAKRAGSLGGGYDADCSSGGAASPHSGSASKAKGKKAEKAALKERQKEERREMAMKPKRTATA